MEKIGCADRYEEIMECYEWLECCVGGNDDDEDDEDDEDDGNDVHTRRIVHQTSRRVPNRIDIEMAEKSEIMVETKSDSPPHPHRRAFI